MMIIQKVKQIEETKPKIIKLIQIIIIKRKN